MLASIFFSVIFVTDVTDAFLRFLSCSTANDRVFFQRFFNYLSLWFRQRWFPFSFVFRGCQRWLPFSFVVFLIKLREFTKLVQT